MLAGQIMDQGDLGFSHVPGVDAGNANSLLVDIQHDFGGILSLLVKDGFQNHDNKIHGGVIIVMEQNLEHGRLFDLVPMFCGYPAF